MSQSSWEIVESAIKEALKKTGGNELRTRQLVAAQALEDPALLKALARPHLTGITAHAISRVLRGRKSLDSVPPANESEEESFGMDILKTFAGGETAQFGQEQYGRPVKRQGVSQSHIDAIRQMVEKAKTTK